MLTSMQDRLVALLPSESLRKEIRKTNYRFSQLDLLAIAYRYAPDFDARISLLQVLAGIFDGDLAAYTRRVIENQHRMLSEFRRCAGDAVYELHIKDTPDAYDERYLCADYGACLKMIPLFYQEYGEVETDRARYEITKRKVFAGANGEAFAEDALGRLVLRPGGRVCSVNVFSANLHPGKCGGMCYACEQPCVDTHEILFPCFTKDADAVRYSDYYGNACYGVVLQDDARPCADCYIIPLDSNAIHYHDYERIHDAHQHIPCPEVEVIAPEQLPPHFQGDYAAYVRHYRGVAG